MKYGVIGSLFFLWGIILGNITWAAVPPAVEQWERGLALIDEGRSSAAAEHFYKLFAKEPHRLDFLDGCFRAERRLSHADSIQIIIEHRVNSVLAPGSPGERFLAAISLKNQMQFSAAADSFSSLARTCRAQENYYSAITATLMACRCRFDSKDSTMIRGSQQEIANMELIVPSHPRLQIESNIILANTHFLMDELNLAEPLYKEALGNAQTFGYLELKMDLLNALGGLTSKQRRQGEAMEFYQQALVVARELGDRKRLCLVLTNLGYEETHQRQFKLARGHLSEAGSLATEWGYNDSMGLIQSGLGALAEMSGDRKEAVRRFRTAMVLSEKGNNIFVELGSRQRLAFNLAMMGQYTEAQFQYETCLEILDRSGGKFILNWVIGGLALTNHKLGYLDRAAELYQRAHSVNLEIGDQLSAAWCLNSLGLIQASRGDYRQALITHHQAWLQYNDLNDREGAGYALTSSAEVYLQLGDYQEALEHSQTVLALAEEINSDELLRKASQIMASVYSATGKSDLAESNFLRVIDLARSWHEVVVEIWALNGLAEHYLSMGRLEEARVYLQKTLDLMGSREYPHVRAKTCRLLGRAAESPTQAVQWAEQAVELAESGGLPEMEWKALCDLGAYHFQLGDKEKAEGLLKRSISLVESLRRQAGSDELRRHMLRPALQPYERLVGLYINGFQDPARAFATSERSRSQILASRLHAALAHSSNQTTRTTDPKERGLTATITFLQSRLQEPNLTRAIRDSLRLQVSVLENEFSLLKLQWSVEDEIEAAILFPGTPEPYKLQKVLEPNEHLLSYFLGSEQSFLFSVSPTKIKTYILPARHLLEDKIQLFLHLQKYETSGESAFPEEVMTNARQDLYSTLVEPAANDFTDKSILVIVPDGLLHRLPFAYLHNGQNYLFESNELFTTPSLQSLGYLRQRAENRPHSSSPKQILSIGCTGGDEDIPVDDRLHPFTATPVTHLPQVVEEAWALAKLFDQAQILTGKAANERKIRSGILASADIIHIAAHSYSDEVDSRRSYILLNRFHGTCDDGTPDLYDGLLLWHEIVALELNASLVTLASCKSAGGMLSSGEGITGLTQAFLLAGSRCVLASQTDVPDGETSWFMERFYKELRSGSTATAALRAVRLQVLHTNLGTEVNSPGSAFVLTGDGTVTYAEKPSSNLTAWLVISFLALVLLLYRRLRSR